MLTGALVWEIYGQVWGTNLTVPPLTEVIATVPDVLGTSEFWRALGTSTSAALLGLALVLPAGFGLGVAAGMSQIGGRFLQPYMTIGLAAPMIAVIPVLVVIFGLDLSTRIATVVVFSLPYMVVNVAAGYRGAPPDLLDMAKSFGVRPFQLFARVRTMAALPAIFAGVRLSVARAWVGVIVAEVLILSTGLGRLLSITASSFQRPEMYVVILAILGTAALTLRMVGITESRILVGRGIVQR